MSERTYHPDRGDLIEVSFQPAAGREIDKRRPAIVLSPVVYNRRSGLCVTVPVTSDLRPGPLWIPTPAGFLPRASQILCDYVKHLDYRECSAKFLARVPDELVDQIVGNLFDLIDPVG